jgi:O-antigen/teichoic acid export membrane protein
MTTPAGNPDAPPAPLDDRAATVGIAGSDVAGTDDGIALTAAGLENAAPPSTPLPAFSFPNIGKHSLIYAAGIFASKGLAFVLLPIYTRYLTPADYGVLQLIMMTMEVIALIAGSRLALGVFHFYHKAETEREKRSVLTTALALLMVTYGVTATMAVVMAPTIAAIVFGDAAGYVGYLRIAVLALAGETLIVVPVAYLQLRTRSKLLVTVQLAKLVLQATLNVIFLIPLGMGVAGVLLSALIGNVAIGLFLTSLLLRENGFVIAGDAARDLVRYGVPLVVTQVATMLLMFGDRFFLNRAVGEAAVGLYGLAFQFGMLLMLVAYMPFEQVWNPTRFEVAKRPERDVIYARAFTYLNLVLVTGGVGIGLFASDVIRIMAAPAFHSAGTLVPGLLLVFLLQAWTSFHNVALLVTERTTWYAISNWIAAGIALLGFVTLIPTFGVWGAVCTAVIAFLVRFLIVVGLGYYLWPVQYQWRPTILTLVWGVMVVSSGSAFSGVPLSVSIPLHAGLFFIYLMVLWRLPVLSQEDRDALHGLYLKVMSTGFPARWGLRAQGRDV